MLQKKWDEYDEQERGIVFEIEDGMSALEVQEFIEQYFNNKPDGRNKKLYNEWKKNVNQLIKEYNKKWGKIYTIIK